MNCELRGRLLAMVAEGQGVRPGLAADGSLGDSCQGLPLDFGKRFV